MHRPAVAALFICSGVATLSSCGTEAATPTEQRDFSPAKPGIAFSTTAPSCGQATHPSGLVVDQVTTPPAYGVAVREDGLTYFTEPYNGGVGITSTQTRTVDGFIATGDVPTGLDFSPDGNTAYVTNQYSYNVGVIDVASATQIATIPIPNGASPFVVRVSPDGSRLFISTNTTTVYIVDTQTRQIISSVQVGFAPNAFAVNPDGRIIYVSASFGGTVTEVDMFSGTALRTFTVGGIAQDMAVTRDGARLYVANESGYLTEITLQSGQVTATISLDGAAFGVGVTPDDAQAYVGIHSVGEVQVFNLQSRRLAATLSVGGNPRRIAFSQLGHIAAIANLDGFVTFVR